MPTAIRLSEFSGWHKPDLGLVEYAGSTANNLVMRGPHGVGVLDDPAATSAALFSDFRNNASKPDFLLVLGRIHHKSLPDTVARLPKGSSRVAAVTQVLD